MATTTLHAPPGESTSRVAGLLGVVLGFTAALVAGGLMVLYVLPTLTY